MLREKTDLKMVRTGGYGRSAVWRPCGVTPQATLQNKSVVCSGSRVTISTVMKLRWSVKLGGIIVKRIQRALAHIRMCVCVCWKKGIYNRHCTNYFQYCTNNAGACWKLSFKSKDRSLLMGIFSLYCVNFFLYIYIFIEQHMHMCTYI